MVKRHVREKVRPSCVAKLDASAAAETRHVKTDKQLLAVALLVLILLVPVVFIVPLPHRLDRLPELVGFDPPLGDRSLLAQLLADILGQLRQDHDGGAA